MKSENKRLEDIVEELTGMVKTLEVIDFLYKAVRVVKLLKKKQIHGNCLHSFFFFHSFLWGVQSQTQYSLQILWSMITIYVIVIFFFLPFY